MPVQWFVLDSAHGDYAGVLSALSTTTAAKYTGTYTQVVRDVEFDTTLKIVKSNITDAERTGTLAALARASEGEGVFVQEWRDHAHADTSIFDFLGESGRTSYYVENNWAQASVGALPTAVSTGSTGRTVQDAVAMEDFDAIPGLVEGARTIWVMDDQLTIANVGWVVSNSASVDQKSGINAKKKTHVRLDYPDRHGCWWTSYLWGSQIIWTDEGETPADGETGHIWSAPLPNFWNSHGKDGWVLDPGFDKDGNVTPNEFGRHLWGTTVEKEMQGEAYSVYSADGFDDTVFIHLPLGETPTNRVADLISENAIIRGKNFRQNDADSPYSFLDRYEDKRRVTSYFLRTKAAQFLRGLNGAPGFDSDLVGHGGFNGNFNHLPNDASVWGTNVNIKGPFVQGCRLRRTMWAYHGSTAAQTDGSTSYGSIVEDLDAEDIGGHNRNYDNGDGHALGWQGVPTDFTIRGTLRMVRCGSGINMYVSTDNDIDPDLIFLKGMKFIMDCTDVDIRDKPEFSSIIEGGNSSGIHLTGDSDIVGDFSGSSITLSGKITGFRIGIRNKWGTQIPITSPVNGGLILARGNAISAASIGVLNRIVSNIFQIVLSGSSGEWAIGNILEDPDTPGNAIASITRVVGSNPTVTLQIKYVDVNTFASADAVNNFDGTGAGTVNGAPTNVGSMQGNSKLSNIRFESDLATFISSEANVGPDGLTTDVNAAGMHIDSNDNIFVGSSTGKFSSDLHGTQDLTGWQANSASDNVYDPDSVAE